MIVLLTILVILNMTLFNNKTVHVLFINLILSITIWLLIAIYYLNIPALLLYGYIVYRAYKHFDTYNKWKS